MFEGEFVKIEGQDLDGVDCYAFHPVGFDFAYYIWNSFWVREVTGKVVSKENSLETWSFIAPAYPEIVTDSSDAEVYVYC